MQLQRTMVLALVHRLPRRWLINYPNHSTSASTLELMLSQRNLRYEKQRRYTLTRH